MAKKTTSRTPVSVEGGPKKATRDSPAADEVIGTHPASTLRSRDGLRRVLLPVAVALLAVLPYLNSLRNGFLFDDVPIVAENPRIRSLGGLPRTFTTDWWDGQRPASLLYRPLVMASYSVDYAAARRGETEPAPARLPARAALPFHLQNLLWHGAASAMLFQLTLELFASPALALTTAALFAVHPVHTEAVDGIVGRAELMSACFVFAALVLAWRTIRDSTKGLQSSGQERDGQSGGLLVVRPALAAVFYLFALLSKESAIVAPAAIFLWMLPRSREERRAIIAGRGFRHLVFGFGAAAIVYLAARRTVLGSFLGAGAGGFQTIDVDNPILSAAGAARILTPLRVFGHVLRLLLFPKTLSADYSYDQIPLVASLDGATIFCALTLSGLAVAAIALRRRATAASFGILFFFLTWLLTSNFVLRIGTILGERLLYLPSAGACIAAAAGLLAGARALGGRREAAGWARREAVRGGRSRDASQVSKLASTASPADLAGSGRNAHAGSPADPVRPSRSIPDLDRSGRAAIAAATVLTTSLVVLGAARTWARNAEWKDNLTLFEATARTSPRSCKALGAYASELFAAGRAKAAVPCAERALEIYAQYPDGHLTLAKAYRALAVDESAATPRDELRAKAAEHARFVVATLPATIDNAESRATAWNILGALALDAGRLDEAVEDYGKSLQSSPRHVASLTGAGVADAMRASASADPHIKDALEEGAVRRFEEALAVDPSNAEAHGNAAATLRSLAARTADAARRTDLERRAEVHEARALAERQNAGQVEALANLHGVRAQRFVEEKRFAEAMAEFREAVRLQPRAARGYLGVGSVLALEAEAETNPERRRALVDEALASFERALALEPQNPTAHMDLGVTYLRQGLDPNKVAEHFRAYLRLVPNSPQRAQMEQTIRQMEPRAGKQMK